MSNLEVQFGDGLIRNLPKVELPSGDSIAFLKLYGDHELMDHCVRALAARAASTDVLLGAEAGGILLAHQLSKQLSIPYCIARKKRRPHMVEPARVQLKSIGTPGQQELFLDDGDCARVRDKRVTFVDEVVSSGGTQAAVRELLSIAGACEMLETLCVALEGTDDTPPDVKFITRLPVLGKGSAK